VLIDSSGRVRVADFSHSVILVEADDIIFSERLLGDVRYIAPECIVPGGQAGLPKPTKAQDVYSYGCIAILVRSAAHQSSLHFTLVSRCCLARYLTGGFLKKVMFLRKRRRVQNLFLKPLKYDPCEVMRVSTDL
jgi:serine/threonine protein kinase